MGRTTASWRASQARHRGRTNQRCKVYGEGRATAVPRVEDVLHNHADGIASMDLFVVPTLSFRLLYGLLILQRDRRQILGLGVTAHPTAEWISRQLTEAYGWNVEPRYIIRDRDAVYGDVFIRRLRAMGIRDRPTAARSPWQKGRSVRSAGNVLTTLSCSASGIFAICCDLTQRTITRLARTFQSIRTRRCREQYMPLVALCPRHFLADSIIGMCVFDFRQAQVPRLIVKCSSSQAFPMRC
jgi:hypothetical protein